MKTRTALVHRHRHRHPSRFQPHDEQAAPDDWQAVLARLDGAYSPHTIRSYRADFNYFANWCLAHNEPSLPTTPLVVAGYLADQTARLRPSTLKRKLAGIRKIHRLHELRDPTDHFEIDLVVRRAQRLKPQRPKQALGITAAIRDRLLAACGDDIVALRDRALIAAGFDTLCRRGELVALRAEDHEPNHFGGLCILVRRAKNDPVGAGRVAHLSLCGLNAIEAWLTAAGITSGPLLRPVYNGVVIDRHPNPMTVSRVLKRRAAEAGLDPAEVDKVPATPSASAPPSS